MPKQCLDLGTFLFGPSPGNFQEFLADRAQRFLLAGDVSCACVRPRFSEDLLYACQVCWYRPKVMEKDGSCGSLANLRMSFSCAA